MSAKNNDVKDKTFAEKVGWAPKKLAKVMHKGREKVSDWEIADTAHWRELVKTIDTSEGPKRVVDTVKLKTWMKENGLTGVKWSGVVTLWMAEMLTRLLNALFLDNNALRSLEKNFRNQELKQPKDKWYSKVKAATAKAAKKHPILASYLLYYLLLFGVTFGGTTAIDGFVDDDADKKKKELVQDNEKQSRDDDVISYEDVLDDNVSDIVPEDAEFVSRVLDKYWPEIAVGLTELETYRNKPTVHAGETRATNGLGVTWDYSYNGKRLEQKACTKNSPVRDKNGNYEQCRLHLIKETLPRLQGAISGKGDFTDRQLVALVLAGYQRPADMRNIADAISKAKNTQQVADAFAYYPGREVWRAGTLKRRWICAAYATGWISAQDLLNMDVDAFSTVELSTVYRGGHFIFGEKTVAYVLSRVRGDKNTVREFLGDFSSGMDIITKIENMDVSQVQESGGAGQSVIEESMGYLVEANALYKGGNYQAAIGLYEKAIDVDPDNLEAYSSLSLMYIKRGNDNKSIDDYKASIKIIDKALGRVKSSKNLVADDETMASSYYNSGVAKEAVADIYKGQNKSKKAKEFYDAAKADFVKAGEYAGKIGATGRVKIYQKATQRVSMKSGTVAVTSHRIHEQRQKNAKRDIFLYGKVVDNSGDKIA